ncbi:MAG: dTDP-4-dehydrorhamnose reductase [Candidatus Woesearchaeota archaeon]
MRILVTGASGFLGRVLCSKLEENNFKVIPLQHDDCEITDYSKLKMLFSRKKPGVVVHAAAITDTDYCEKNKEECFKVNIVGTEFVQNLCNNLKINMVLLSTDFVFDGKKGNYKEEDFRNPVNYYGFSKMVAEDITEKLENHLIIRTSSIFGYFHPKKMDFPSFVITNLSAGKEVKIAKDFFRKPTFVEDLANAIIFLIKKRQNGIFHCCGSERISSYEFALKIATHFNLNKSLIKPVLSKEINLKAKRPRDSSLNTKKIENLGYRFMNLDSAIEKSDYREML